MDSLQRHKANFKKWPTRDLTAYEKIALDSLKLVEKVTLKRQKAALRISKQPGQG